MNTILPIQKNYKRQLITFTSTNLVKRSLLVLSACVFILQAKSQSSNTLAQADEYFASGDYFTAAGLYEQILHPRVKQKTPANFPLNGRKNSSQTGSMQVDKLEVLYKQAESYRLANYWTEASAKYQKCFEKDPAKYADGLYWYSVCQRSLGNYTVAEENATKFLKTCVAGSPNMQAAKKELETLQFIRNQVVRPDSILYRVQKINTSFGTEKGVFAPLADRGNQFVITSTQTDAVVKPGVNPFHNRLFYSTLIDGNMQNIDPVMIEGIDSSFNQAAASLSASGNYLYFTQWKKDNGRIISSIVYSARKENAWTKPLAASSINLEGYNSKHPFCSPDGKYIFFASDRPGGSGQFDIWYAGLRADGTTTAPINVGTVLNTSANEQAPFYHESSGTLVFSSDRRPGMGGYDLFTTTGWEQEWKTPENMGHPVNSPRDDMYFFAPEKSTLLNRAIISSDRGSECCLETYAIARAPKKQVITGVIRDCRNNEPASGADVTLKNRSGKTWHISTGENGTYEFEIAEQVNSYQLSIAKDGYKETVSGISVSGSNESEWLKDIHYNTAICLERKLVIKVENVVTVYFDFDQSKLKDRGMVVLDSIHAVLTEHSTATIQISGYTDGLGTDEYNKVLSDKRARACADYLVTMGIDSARISFESFGACCPVEMEKINGRDNPDGRSKNRRALINIAKD